MFNCFSTFQFISEGALLKFVSFFSFTLLEGGGGGEANEKTT